MLDPSVDFLNHGSFGALPKRVALAQDRVRAFIEARPIERLGRRCRELLAPARQRVAAFVGVQPDEIGFVTNATDAVNAVLRSMDLKPGDQLVTTDHVYNAVRQTMRYVARRAGAECIEIPIAVPLEPPEKVAAQVLERLGPRARLLLLDHVSSPTALRFPVELIIAAAEGRGIPVLVDGAHAPGTLPLDISALGCSYYAANLHKWVCAPKGSAFLFARAEAQAELHPTIISHFLDQGFRAEFDWQGTRDISPWLCVPDALDFLDDASLGFGWSRVMEHNHRLARWVQERLCTRWEVERLCGPEHLGAMTTVLLPAPLQPGGAAGIARFEEIQLALSERFLIEVPVIEWNGRRFVRPCCQVYNRPEQYERLADAVLMLAQQRATEQEDARRPPPKAG